MHDSKELIQKLKNKGWTDQELNHAEYVFSKHNESHHIIHPIYDKILHWFLFLLIIIGNFLSMLFLYPLMLYFNNWFIYFLTALLAILIGAIFETTINNMTSLKKHHHFLIGIILPIISIALFSFFVYKTEILFTKKPIDISLILITYILFYNIPYYARRITNSIKNKIRKNNTE